MRLRWLDRTTLPVEAERLTPEFVLGLAPDVIARTPIRVGNQDAQLGDLFAVDPAEVDDDTLTLEGDLRHVRGIGRGMGQGRLVIRGFAGPHLAAGMTGGSVEVHGDADEWAGAGMRGGLLRIRGRAGSHLGASYPGDRLGMRDGVILVNGSVGDEAGRRMRRGLIAVGGGAGEVCGKGMVAGSILVFGPLGLYPGSGMERGTIASFSGEMPTLLPSFVPSGRYRFPFLTVYLRRLESWGFPVPGEVFSAEMGRYNGDLADGGQGEILTLSGDNER